MLDHQLIFCTRKVKWAKFNNHCNVFLRSLHSKDLSNALHSQCVCRKFQRVNFLNYERFSRVDAACTDFLRKLMKVADEIAPKELWKTLMSMDLPSKAVAASNIYLKDKTV